MTIEKKGDKNYVWEIDINKHTLALARGVIRGSGFGVAVAGTSALG